MSSIPYGFGDKLRRKGIIKSKFKNWNLKFYMEF